MPLSPNIPPTTDRRAPSPKRDNDVKPTVGHVVTKTAYVAMVHADDAQVNVRVKRACQARSLVKQLFDIASAENSHYQKIMDVSKENMAMRNQWRKVFRQAEKLMTSVPLQIENK